MNSRSSAPRVFDHLASPHHMRAVRPKLELGAQLGDAVAVLALAQQHDAEIEVQIICRRIDGHRSA
jgi:hypothetical protein